MDSRRDFIRKAGGLGLLAFGGCRCSAGRVRGDAVSPNYWCTWGIQNRMLGKVKRSPLAFAGDQGAARARDNINEDFVFGKGGWTGIFPKSRERLWMMLDDSYVPSGKARAEWRAKIEDCAAAGIGYLKVDWGMRSGSVGFRRLAHRPVKERDDSLLRKRMECADGR